MIDGQVHESLQSVRCFSVFVEFSLHSAAIYDVVVGVAVALTRARTPPTGRFAVRIARVKAS